MVFYSSACSTNRMQLEVKSCIAEIRKGKNESSVRRQYAELKSGRNIELKGEMCLLSQMGKKSCALSVLSELLSTKNESWKKCKKSRKSSGILFSYFCTNTTPEMKKAEFCKQCRSRRGSS